MQQKNVYLKSLTADEQIAISGGIMVRIPQKLDVAWFFSLGIPISWDIEFLQSSHPYAPDIITPSRFSTTVGYFLFCIYYLIQ